MTPITLSEEMTKYRTILNEAWGKEMHTPASKKGMFKGKTKEELRSQLAAAKKRAKAHHDAGTKESESLKTKIKELEFALRAKNKFGKVNESFIDSLREGQATVNFPFVREFDDYHEISFFRDQLLSLGIRAKSKEVGFSGGNYVGVFWLNGEPMNNQILAGLLQKADLVLDESRKVNEDEQAGEEAICKGCKKKKTGCICESVSLKENEECTHTKEWYQSGKKCGKCGKPYCENERRKLTMDSKTERISGPFSKSGSLARKLAESESEGCMHKWKKEGSDKNNNYFKCACGATNTKKKTN